MTILSPAQERLLEELTPIAIIATDGSKRKLQTLSPRTSTLIIGPSGSGKTHIASHLAGKLGLSCLRLNMASWILIGSKSDEWTWMTIVEWLSELTTGGVLILDEIDKLSSESTTSEYMRFIRLELHDILDSKIPPQLKIELEEGRSASSPSYWQNIDRMAIANTLKERVLIIGCGTFQQSWIANQKPVQTIGFNGADKKEKPQKEPPKPPSREQILKGIDPELRQRFRDEISILPTMTREDYVHVANQIISKLPLEYRDAWNENLEDAIGRAIQGTLGIRIFEELLLKAMVVSQRREKPGRIPVPSEDLLKDITSPRGQYI
jgi:ATP-dependent protease Clp ATPase subunit